MYLGDVPLEESFQPVFLKSMKLLPFLSSSSWMSRLFKKSLIPMHSVIYFRPCRFHAQVAMTSIVDSEAHYERRMREMGMTDAGSRVILTRMVSWLSHMVSQV